MYPPLHQNPTQPRATTSAFVSPVLDEASNDGAKEKPTEKGPGDWGVNDVIAWLEREGFEEDVCRKFRANKITGTNLFKLNVNVLKDEIRVEEWGTRDAIDEAIKGLHPSETSSMAIADVTLAHPATYGTKRPLEEDPTEHICRTLLQPFENIPTYAQDCVPLMEAALLEKLPVDRIMFNEIRPKYPSLAKWLSPAYGELSNVISCALQDLTGQEASEQEGSKNMLHSPVDALVRKPLRLITRRVGGMQIRVDRNRTDPGSTLISHCCPDFLLWLSDLLLFVGEEKANAGDDAKEDLRNKFLEIDSTFFGDIKFMLCYTLVGHTIRFYAADGSPKIPDPLVSLTQTFDLTELEGRFNILRAVINIARIFLTVNHLVPSDSDRYPLAKRRKYDSSDLFFGPKFVEKKIPVEKLPYSQSDLQARVSFLRSMYECAKGCRGLVQVRDDLDNEGPRLDDYHKHYRVNLATRGVPQRPRTENVLRSLVKDVVSGLSVLHDRGFLHRDIRYPNIVYDRSRNQYALIDFEHSGPEPRLDPSNCVPDSPWLKDWDSKTLENGTYKKSSDMYQLGKMLKTQFDSIILTGEGKEFVAKLMRKQMTAGESLEHKWIRDFHEV